MDYRDALRAAVGPENVLDDDATRVHWSRSTLPQGTIPSVVVRPGSTAEVQAIVGIAQRHRLALHPISTGKNWGYTDGCAAHDGQVLLDLRRMNRIVEVNEELAYAIIEPGVTQGQLAEFLESQGLALWVDATGAGPDASIVGNTLERGFGHTVHGDRFLNSCGLEVVLPDGQVLRTGLGHYDNAQAAAVYKWGLGPYLDGLFTQSNFGIVTRMTIWLIPKPESFAAFMVSVPREEDVGELVDVLRKLRLSGTLRTPVHLFNDLRVLAGLERFPWNETDGTHGVPRDWFEAAKQRYGVEAWHGTGAFHGSDAEVAAAMRTLKRAVRGTAARVVFLTDRRLALGRRVARLLNLVGLGKKLAFRLNKVQVIYDLLRGRASHACLDGARWRVRPGPSTSNLSDPLAQNAGLLWISPVLPMTRTHVARVAALTRPIFERYGFEYQVTLSAVTARALCSVMTICYDRSSPAETERARACHEELFDVLTAAGYTPYRAGNLSMSRLAERSEVFWDVVAALKAALDPGGILAPGHYQPHA